MADISEEYNSPFRFILRSILVCFLVWFLEENSVILINKRVPMGPIFHDSWATLGYSSFCL